MMKYNCINCGALFNAEKELESHDCPAKPRLFVMFDYDFWAKKVAEANATSRKKFQEEKKFEIESIKVKIAKLREELKEVRSKKFVPREISREEYLKDLEENRKWAEENGIEFVVMTKEEYLKCKNGENMSIEEKEEKEEKYDVEKMREVMIDYCLHAEKDRVIHECDMMTFIIHGWEIFPEEEKMFVRFYGEMEDEDGNFRSAMLDVPFDYDYEECWDGAIAYFEEEKEWD